MDKVSEVGQSHHNPSMEKGRAHVIALQLRTYSQFIAPGQGGVSLIQEYGP